jgi:hypothetical protein
MDLICEYNSDIDEAISTEHESNTKEEKDCANLIIETKNGYFTKAYLEQRKKQHLDWLDDVMSSMSIDNMHTTKDGKIQWANNSYLSKMKPHSCLCFPIESKEHGAYLKRMEDSYYDYHLIVDGSGLHHYLPHKRAENSMSTSTETPEQDGKEVTNRRYQENAENSLSNSIEMPELDNYGPVHRPLQSIVNIPPLSSLNKRIDISKPVITSIVMGHSFVERLREGLVSIIEHVEEHDKSPSNLWIDDMLKTVGNRVFLLGEPGAHLTSLPQFYVETVHLYPSIIVLDIGSNDLCSKHQDPKELAKRTVIEAEIMFHVYKKLKIVVLCGIITKYSIWPNQKKLEDFNEDTKIYNEELKNLTFNDNRIIVWFHPGLGELNEQLSTDGTHPNTVDGFQRYSTSISKILTKSKKEMILRKNEDIVETQTRTQSYKTRVNRNRRHRRNRQAKPYYRNYRNQ